MEHKKIILMMVAVFSIAILLSQNNAPLVYAQIVAHDTSITGLSYIYSRPTSTVNYLAGVKSSNNSVEVYSINGLTGALTLVRTISFDTFATTIPTQTATVRMMACSGTICYVTVDGSTTDKLIGINIDSGTIVGGYSKTTIEKGIAIAPSGVYLAVDSGANRRLSLISTTAGNCPTDQNSCTITWIALGTAGTNLTTTPIGLAYGVIGGTAYVEVITTNAVSNIHLWNVQNNGFASVCAVNLATSIVDVEYTNNRFWIVLSTASVYAYDETCTADYSALSPICSATNTYIDLASSSANEELYVACKDNVNTFDSDTGVITSTYSTSQTVASNYVAYNYFKDALIVNTPNVVRLFFVSGADFENYDEDRPRTNPLTNPNGTGNSDNGRCGNGTVLDCVGTGTSPFTGITGGQNATIITAQLTNGIGITHCSTTNDSDAETCGSGLFMFAFLILLLEFLALAGYLGMTAKLNADRTIVDVALIMGIIGFVSVAIGFYLDWIPDLVFYTIIVLIAGLATFGILGKIRGRE